MAKIYMLVFLIFSTIISPAQSVGIGTTIPQYTLHVANSTTESSVGINATGTSGQALLNLSIGNRIDGNSLFFLKYRSTVSGNLLSGIPKSNLSIIGADAGAGALLLSTNQNSPMYFSTNNAERMRITNSGHIGMNTTNTTYGWLAVKSSDNIAAIDVTNDYSGGLTYGIQSQIVSSAGAAVIGVSSTSGGSSAFTTGSYGIIGTSGSSGTAVGAFTVSGGTALVAKVTTGTGTAIDVDNGFIKVSGANKTAIIATAVLGSNITGNLITLNYNLMASTDIIIVTHNFQAAYIGSVGTWWNGTAWTVFREDGQSMPDGEKFNVLIIKQ